MNQSIINTYGIKLFTKVIDLPIAGRSARKVIKCSNDSLGEFLISWDNPQKINDYLIPDINQVLASPGTQLENGSPTINIVLEEVNVELLDNDYNLLFTLPTVDFKQIVEGWRDFLQEPPTAQDLHRKTKHFPSEEK